MTGNLVEFHEAAAAEYEAAYAWYFERSRLAATRFAEEVSRSLNLISEAPHRWPVHTHGTRKFLLHHFPFAIIYRKPSSVVQVVAVAHGHRRPGYWKDRL